MPTENERRRESAREMWLTQLTPEQRSEIDAARQASICSAHREPDPDCPRCPVPVGCGCLGAGVYACPHWPGTIRGASVTMGVADEVTEGMKYPCHRRHAHQPWCLPVDEMGEALQRSIERRD